MIVLVFFVTCFVVSRVIRCISRTCTIVSAYALNRCVLAYHPGTSGNIPPPMPSTFLKVGSGTLVLRWAFYP